MSHETNVSGARVGIYSLTDQLDDPDEANMVLRPNARDLSAIGDRLAGTELAIGFPHLGSRSIYPTPRERELARKLIEHGAGLLVCTGSHFVKGFMVCDGVPVIYGLGNHWFTWSGGDTEEIGIHLVVALGQGGRLEGIYAIPFYNQIIDGRTGPLDEGDFERFREEFAARSVDDPGLVWRDPRMQRGLGEHLRNLNVERLRSLRWRHVVYGLKVLYHRIIK